MASLVLMLLLLLPTPTLGRSGVLTPLQVAGYERAEGYKSIRTQKNKRNLSKRPAREGASLLCEVSLSSLGRGKE